MGGTHELVLSCRVFNVQDGTDPSRTDIYEVEYLSFVEPL